MINQSHNFRINFFYFIALLIIILFGVDLSYLVRLGDNVPNFLLIIKTKNLSLIFIIMLPFIYKKLFKIIASNKLILIYFVWVLCLTITSYFVSKLLGYKPRFSNEVRTIEQLGGLILGIVFGYLIFNLIIFKQKLLTRNIKFSIFIVFCGIIYQILFHGYETIFNYRLYGITGEPKGLGLYLAAFISALYFSTKKKNFKEILIILLCIFAMLLSKSATAFIAFIFVFLIYIISNNNFSIRNLKNFFLILLIVIFLVIFFNNIFQFDEMILGRISDYYSGKYVETIQEQLSFPILGSLTVEGNDFPVFYFFKENPLFIFTGIGLGQESIYTFGYVDEFGPFGFMKPYFKGYVTPNFALLVNTANFGLPFVIILFVWGYQIARKKTDNLTTDEKFLFYFFLSHFFISLIIFRREIPLSASIFILMLFSDLIIKKNS